VSLGVSLSALGGAAIGRGFGLHVAAVAGLLASFAVGIYNWRLSVYGLLLYLPYSGVAAILMYPNTTPAVLAKDFLLVLPAYLGFILRQLSARKSMSIPRGPVWLIVCFSTLVIAQTLNPALPSLIVGAIGAKVWLFYIPLYLLGYHLIRSRRDLHRVLTVISVAAVIPTLIGIVEAVLIYTGRASVVYGFYGEAAAAVTQNFAAFNLTGGGTLHRISSTFTFVSQYFAFTMTMMTVIYAWWRGVLVEGRLAYIGSAVWLLTLLAGFLSGARGAIAFIPVMVVLLLLLQRPKAGLILRGAVGSIIVFSGAAAILGSSIANLLSYVAALSTQHFRSVFLGGFRDGFSLTLTGLGAGTNTNGARHVLSQPELYASASGSWYESWYVKALVELGVPGLVLVVALMAVLLMQGLDRHRSLTDKRLKVISASLMAFLIWNLIYGIKGQFMDIDPINVYFWFFVGILARLPSLEEKAQAAGGDHVTG
jgi:hypothetical protein